MQLDLMIYVWPCHPPRKVSHNLLQIIQALFVSPNVPRRIKMHSLPTLIAEKRLLSFASHQEFLFRHAKHFDNSCQLVLLILARQQRISGVQFG
jgi:hypothetical protein